MLRRNHAIPKTWEATRLATCITLIDYGTNAPSNDYRAGYPVVAIPEVVSSRFQLGDCPYADIPREEAEACRLEPDDVLLVRTNGNPDFIGKSTVIGEEARTQHIVFASYLIRVRTRKDRLLGAYLNYFLASPLGRQQATAMANTSAGNHNIGTRSLRQFWIPRPDLNEQQEIVGLINAAEDNIEAIEREMEALRRLKRSLLQALLTGKVRVKGE